ncbi:MAG: hypothetical protein Q9M32_02800 [Sulfurimonas sp.]|nr:hypothetical protein [Sulfurimonas sp.]MDQ7060463.1 hypothetical protein [Sulfurimonas sp.]
MQVAQYLFQSPSTSSVQVGRLDPSSKEEDTSSKKTSPEQSLQAKTAGEILSPNTANTVENLNPTVISNQLLDVYA